MWKRIKETKIYKKAVNAKWAIYWAKFMTTAAETCRKNMKIVTENPGSENEWQHSSCTGCPFEVKELGKNKTTGCILSCPENWDDPKVIGHITRAMIREVARSDGKKTN